MSFWYTLKSMFRRPRRRKTRVIILQVWQDGGGTNILAKLPLDLAENILPEVLVRQPDETWKCYGPLSGGLIENTGHWLHYQLSSCHQNPAPASDGSQDQRRQAFYDQVGTPSTCDGSSSSGSIPGPGRARSSGYDGTKSTPHAGLCIGDDLAWLRMHANGRPRSELGGG